VANRNGPIDPERLTEVDRSGRYPDPARDAVDSDGRVSDVAEPATCKRGGSEGCDRGDRDGGRVETSSPSSSISKYVAVAGA